MLRVLRVNVSVPSSVSGGGNGTETAECYTTTSSLSLLGWFFAGRLLIHSLSNIIADCLKPPAYGIPRIAGRQGTLGNIREKGEGTHPFSKSVDKRTHILSITPIHSLDKPHISPLAAPEKAPSDVHRVSRCIRLLARKVYVQRGEIVSLPYLFAN
jgi:hypothetical protein